MSPSEPSQHPPDYRPGTIGELVRVRPHPTVVRLEEETAAPWIRETFLVTEPIAHHLQALAAVLDRRTGSGAFLIGQYGSGKSHLLAYLGQALAAGELGGRKPRVAAVSLLNFPATVPLEEAVGAALSLATPTADRRPAWRRLLAAHPQGLVLLLDELSEFLRSKPDRRAFTEDVRTLQFLGELAQGHPLWVVAALQEQIEHTGELEHGLYRKIKDRFPLRLLLTPAHVEELVAGSILDKLPGYDEAVAALIADLRRLHPELPLDGGALARLYPLHPATLELLEEVRDRFSQARGVVDFVVGQLGGVPERELPPFLQRPWGDLLTPDRIVDHFADLFELQPELVPIAQTVLPHYRREMGRLFPEPARQELARRLLHLLLLTHLAPARDGLTAAEAVAWLLPTVSRLAPAKNHQVVAAVLEQLATTGRYVGHDGERFRLDLAEEGTALFERLLAREMEELAGVAPAVLVEELAALLGDDAFNPLRLPRNVWQHRRLRWHFHERPYAVFVGEDPPPAVHDEELRATLVLRPPWGAPGPASGCITLVPAPLVPDEAMAELAALGRLRQRPWNAETRRRLEERYRKGLALFAARLEQSYLAGTLFDADGVSQAPPRLAPPLALDPFLERLAEWALRRIYPAFERSAPTHGPLPRESYRRFLRHAFTEELGSEAADEVVKLVREAYLVPLKLLRRQGRSYSLAPNLERHELVRQILPLVEHRPDPMTLYRHLASPPHGLVRDQAALLLAVLAIAGEVEVVKRGRSLRDGYETLPDPLAYDRVEPASGLPPEQLRALERLAAALDLPAVREWTGAAQRRVAKQLVERGRRVRGELAPLRRRLAETGETGDLERRLEQALTTWGLLEAAEGGELAAVGGFLAALGPPEAAVAELAELGRLPERLERLGRERQRFLHLFGHPGFAAAAGTALALRCEALGRPPSLGLPAELAHWLEEARELYEEYAAGYRERHDAFWRRLGDRPGWSWQPPPVAELPLVGLAATVVEARRHQESARQRRCPRLVDLAYQPICSCGFDGVTAPAAEPLERLESLAREIEAALTSYFGAAEVRRRAASWIEQGLAPSPSLTAYVAGEEPYPSEVPEPTLFERHLAGAGVAREVPGERLLEVLGPRVWEPGAALAELRRFFDDLGAERVRFRAATPPEAVDLAAWCGEQALRHGLTLPAAGRREAGRAVGGRIEPAWVGPAALARLEELGFDDEVVIEVLRLLVEGRLEAPPPGQLSPAAAAAWELVHPVRPAEARQLAAAAARLYRWHGLLEAAFGERWRERLAELAATPPGAPAPPLVELLGRFPDHRWLVVDGLGLPLVPALEAAAAEVFAGRTPRWEAAAEVPAPTTTDGWYGELLAGGLGDRPVDKIDAVDRLLHQPGIAFPELERLAVAQLAVAWRRLAPACDPAAPLLLFADHGFRLAPDGRGFRHGGASALERLVPVWELAPEG